MAAVEVDGLTVRYGEVVAVDAVSFEAQAGQITAVLGPNGAGKTTTVEVLEGFRRPDTGRTTVVGLDPRADHAALTRRVGVMLQGGGVGPGVRVRPLAQGDGHAIPAAIAYNNLASKAAVGKAAVNAQDAVVPLRKDVVNAINVPVHHEALLQAGPARTDLDGRRIPACRRRGVTQHPA